MMPTPPVWNDYISRSDNRSLGELLASFFVFRNKLRLEPFHAEQCVTLLSTVWRAISLGTSAKATFSEYSW